MTRLGKACLCDDRHHDCDHPDQWCDRPIGGEWSPWFCVPCDRISAGFARIEQSLTTAHNRGSRHGMAILTEPQVLQIVALLDAGFTQRSIAAPYGVARFTISEIEQGANWGWLTSRTSHRPVRRSRVLVSAA